MRTVKRSVDINPGKWPVTPAILCIQGAISRSVWDFVREGTWDQAVWPFDVSIKWPLKLYLRLEGTL